MGGCFWGSGGGAPQPPEAKGGLGAKPPAAEGQRGYEGKAPSRRRPMGVWGQSPQPPEARGSGAEPPALENFAFFWKNNVILGLF